MNTFSKEHFLAARAEWDAGEFSDEWKPYRHAAAMRGFIYPPQGTKWDSWTDDEPSQRAVLIQMIRERPKATMEAINRSRSWQEVIGDLMREREWAGDQADLDERAERKRRLDDEPTARQAAESLRTILGSVR